MNNELTDLTNIPAPTLTLDPVSDGEVAEASIIEVDPPAAPSLADSLSAEELAQVTLQDHALLMDFFRKGDAQGAEYAMAIHMRHAMDEMELEV